MDFRGGVEWMNVTASRRGPVWEDIIKMELKEIEWNGEEWVSVFEDIDKRRAVRNIVIDIWIA